MKMLFYILAVLVIAGSAVLSFHNKGKFQGQVLRKREVQADNVRLAASISTAEATLDGLQNDVEQARTSIAEEKEKMDNLLAENRRAVTERTELEAKGKQFNEELAEVEAMRKEVADLLGEVNVTLEQLPEEIDRIKQELEEQQTARDKLLDLVAEQETAVAKNHDEANRLDGRLVSRSESIRRNALQSVVSGVNSEWGFAMVGAGANSGITSETRFLVQRDNVVIGRLLPTAISPNETMADIDAKSLNPGVTIRVGDRVILQNVNR
jgi:phage-related tail protein